MFPTRFNANAAIGSACWSMEVIAVEDPTRPPVVVDKTFAPDFIAEESILCNTNFRLMYKMHHKFPQCGV